ncbi:MAG: hypothetical protein ACJAS1_005341 [Oleiphilaceae bacterium]|jgi:hypothetical protein
MSQVTLQGLEAGGEFELSFNTNKAYTRFGQEYVKCYANVSVGGNFTKPIPSGELKYQVGFDLKCGCNSVLGEFNKAYNKTFGNQELAMSRVKLDLDYTAEIVICSLVSSEKYIKPLSHQFDEAESFFNHPELESVKLEEDSYTDKDGLVQFIVAAPLIDNKEVMQKLTEQKDYLVGITSVVTAYINRYALKYGDQYKTDPDLWAKAVSMIPLMGPSKLDEQGYSRHIRGVSIATDFIEFILDTVVSQGTAALGSFQKFLEKQGDAIKFGIEKNKDYYKTNSLGVTAEVFKVGDSFIYTPKIQQYRINFDRSNSKFTSACGSAEFVDINFDYIYSASVFDYKALEDPEVKEQFDAFIRNQRKAQIEDASTFFNDDFEVNDPLLNS